MASVIIMNSRKRNKSDCTEYRDDNMYELLALPSEPWEADMVLGVLSGGRCEEFF